MTKVAIWCRHKGDNIIGIGPHIPWHVKSDFRRFRRITTGQALAAGQKTYESFPGRTLPDRRIFVLTPEENYEVSDPEKHFVVNDVRFFKDFEEDLYIVGGATIYKPVYDRRRQADARNRRRLRLRRRTEGGT